MMKEDNKENENLVESSNKSKKTMIKLRTTYIWLTKLGY